MPPALHLPRPSAVLRDRPTLRRRAGAMALAVAINLLILFALIGLNAGAQHAPLFEGGTMTLITLGREPQEQATVTRRAAPDPDRPTPLRAPHALPPPPVKPPKLPSRNPLPILYLSKQELASADIAKLGTPARPGVDTGSSSGAPGDTEMVGTAPDGQPLYAAEWVRRPTDAELGGYLPRTMPAEGWGLIACKTAARYHVEDCVELGNSPPGSHLAGAVRQAAWQFLVRPPRVGGRELTGTWVRIRIDYTQAKTAEN